ncbi:MAG: type VI secretion system protein, partial [Planctomycetes bacterium]|nr:type VI secretion system protein [Planctomycetota bacterium]
MSQSAAHPDLRSASFSGSGATPLDRSWRAGLNLIARSRSRRARPWLLSFGQFDTGRKALLDYHAVAVAAMATSGGHGEISWHLTKANLWLDLANGLEKTTDERWADLLERFTRHHRPSAVAVWLDAAALVTAPPSGIAGLAAIVRDRLDTLAESLRSRPPVTLIVDGLDRLYGLSSLLNHLAPEVLAEPLGLTRPAVATTPAAFVSLALTEARRRLTTLSADPLRPAGLQAPAEFSRLERPLVSLC